MTKDLPVRPDLEQLRHQAKDLLRAIRAGDAAALAELQQHHPQPPAAATARLADAQLAVARSYEVPSWPRLVQACRLMDAIWRDDETTIRALVARNPQLVHEDTRVRRSNWGRPLSYAATAGRSRIVHLMHELGATDHAYALDRALMKGHADIARQLHAWLGRPAVPGSSLDGPAYTLNVAGTALAFELGATVRDATGRRTAPVDVVLETDSRNPAAKHAILDLYVQHGLELPDTPAMALHRGRLDLLAAHLRRDPGLLTRQFAHPEIYPPELGCHDEVLATHGTPLAGATLLHMCADYDELEIARWLLAQGMPVDARAAIDADGFGGHTALFATVVSQPNFWMNHLGRPQVAPFTELLLAHGADPNARASLRKQLHPGYGDEPLREYRDVTPLGWGERFHRRVFVSEPAMRLVAAAGGGR